MKEVKVLDDLGFNFKFGKQLLSEGIGNFSYHSMSLVSVILKEKNSLDADPIFCFFGGGEWGVLFKTRYLVGQCHYSSDFVCVMKWCRVHKHTI